MPKFHINIKWVLDCVLNITTLWVIAVAQPLFELMGRYPDFLAAHATRPQEILIVIASIIGLVPTVLALTEIILRLVSINLQKNFNYLIFIILISLISLPIMGKILTVSDFLVIGTSALTGVIGTCVFYKSSAVKSALKISSICILAFPVYLIFFTPLRALIFPKMTEKQSIHIENAPPIIFVIFDELPLVSLMDENHLIDPIRYPNFAKLADRSFWFRNFTVNAPATAWSIPTILTGNYPKIHLPATASNFPKSLFSLLSSSYDIYAIGDFMESMCLENCVIESNKDIYSNHILATFMDLLILYCRIIAPHEIGNKLPIVTGSWRDFTRDRYRFKNLPWRVSEFYDFVSNITATHKPTLHIIKSSFVHYLWSYMPSGHQYFPVDIPGYDTNPPQEENVCRWPKNEWLVYQGYQRHLLEVEAADLVLGEMLNHLEANNLFDQSLIIITSDHGGIISSGKKQRGETSDAEIESDLMPVPFLIKLPEQKQGIINDENVESIDILPTILDLLKIRLAWKMDGRSMFDHSLPKRKNKTMYHFNNILTYSDDGFAKFKSLKRKLAFFGSGRSKPGGLFKIGRYGNIVGTPISQFNITQAYEYKVTFADRFKFQNVDISRKIDIPCRISGTINNNYIIPEKPIQIAIVINDTIAAVTQTFASGDNYSLEFYAIFPEENLIKGFNKVNFFAITENEAGKILLSPLIETNSM